ncbi:hypothetical protein PV08_01799 [Exophiala spinifera]|uniref:AB hydrolase-1 domain-containing protein n=1 Tax=Exophiala spinifera TaxID=91928 RepID=A0A0D2CCJ2_9EURO|nr:uncharacterized protein PV08_01799 [Exophiala spinifera]KIW21219.1 hypothetical protein PV08_01799 [Exophiala spinifera]
MGDSDKPTDPQLYNFKDHSADLQEILDRESVGRVVVVGHDAGAVAAQRFYLFQPKNVVGMILLNVAYKHPSYQPFDLPKLIQLMRQLFGYDAWAYWDYTSSDRAAGIINKNPVLMYEALHGDRPDWMKTVLGNFGALEAYTKGEMERVPVKAYAKPGQEEWVEHNVQSKVENEIPPERLKMNFPVMFIACTDDAACRAEMMKPAVAAGLLPDLETNWLNCGHWSPLERPGEISGMIISYMSRHFSAA